MTDKEAIKPLKKRFHYHNHLLDDATKEMNEWTGENKVVEIHLFQMFSSVFKHHDHDEAEALFIVGTRETTPSLEAVSAAPVKPWLFSRVFALLGASFCAIFVTGHVFRNECFPEYFGLPTDDRIFGRWDLIAGCDDDFVLINSLWQWRFMGIGPNCGLY
ncbi:hypothetical protein OE230_10825 [Levilactobacillus brevis]|nr:hypothetical protein OE230_10825 [Levilactobacillus brevis]